MSYRSEGNTTNTIQGLSAPALVYRAAKRLLWEPVSHTRGGRVHHAVQPLMLSLYRPRRRLAVLVGRDLNPWVSLAEFPWLLAGRNDVAWLGHYLPRASDFSDDGKVWRAGYGPRLRDWYGVDQLAGALGRLRRNPNTRRAAVNLWDPQVDNAAGVADVACTTSLHLGTYRGRLDMHVLMRSNDLWWGYSGVNVVNWTLLQELFANLLGLGLGVYYHTATNLHLYERHWSKATHLQREPHFYTAPLAPDGTTISMEPLGADTLPGFTQLCRAALDVVEAARFTRPMPGQEALEELAARIGCSARAWPAQWAYMMLLHEYRDHLPGHGWLDALRPLRNRAWVGAVLEYLSRNYPHELDWPWLNQALQFGRRWRGTFAAQHRQLLHHHNQTEQS